MKQNNKELLIEAQAWNILINAYGSHGRGKEAIIIYHNMLAAQVQPTKLTFNALFSACSHSYLIDECEHLYHSMEEKHKIVPDIMHQNCVVDCFARAGKLDKALDFVTHKVRQPGMLLCIVILTFQLN